MKHPDDPKDDPSSAPESGTVRDETSGNMPASQGRPRGADTTPQDGKSEGGDQPSLAREEP